jgi:hypothetical protein
LVTANRQLIFDGHAKNLSCAFEAGHVDITLSSDIPSFQAHFRSHYEPQ